MGRQQGLNKKRNKKLSIELKGRNGPEMGGGIDDVYLIEWSGSIFRWGIFYGQKKGEKEARKIHTQKYLVEWVILFGVWAIFVLM
jgi:hypothetical protein